MYKFMRLHLFLGILSIGESAFAYDFPSAQCKEPQLSQQIDECISEQRMLMDKFLNEEYQQLVKRINNTYRLNKTLGGEFRQVVKRAQQAWITFRDANCAIEAFEIEKGTPSYNTTINGCIAKMSNERAMELRKILP